MVNGIERPLDLLNASKGKEVLVQLKGEKAFVGTLAAFDIHINVVLDNAKEIEGGEVKVRLDGGYLAEALRACGGMVDFKLTDAKSPTVFAVDGYQLVVMPMLTAEAKAGDKAKAEAEPVAETDSQKPEAEAVTEAEEVAEAVAVAEAEAIAEAEAKPKRKRKAKEPVPVA